MPVDRTRTRALPIGRHRQVVEIHRHPVLRSTRRTRTNQIEFNFIAKRHLAKLHQGEEPVTGKHVADGLRAYLIALAGPDDAISEHLVQRIAASNEALVRKQFLFGSSHLTKHYLVAGR